jgi:hypothetical protein
VLKVAAGREHVLPVEEGVRDLGIAELRRLKQLEEGNRKLKQLVADLSLHKTIPQEAPQQKR